MATNKTIQTDNSVIEFLKSVQDEKKRKDSFAMISIMKEQSGFEPKMWGPSIVGFGSYHYKYESGREGDAPLIGFSPRKDAISLYLRQNFDGRKSLLEKFGKHKTGKACIYFKKMDDIDTGILKKMIAASLKYSKSNRSAGC